MANTMEIYMDRYCKIKISIQVVVVLGTRSSINFASIFTNRSNTIVPNKKEKENSSQPTISINNNSIEQMESWKVQLMYHGQQLCIEQVATQRLWRELWKRRDEADHEGPRDFTRRAIDRGGSGRRAATIATGIGGSDFSRPSLPLPRRPGNAKLRRVPVTACEK